MKKYVVYYQWEETVEGDNCNHHFLEFDTIVEAVSQYNNLGTSNKRILKLVTWKTEVTDITEQERT